MGKLFTLIPAGPVGGDMTSRFRVQLNKKPTVQEFINAVKENKEWGSISIRDKAGKTLLHIGYDHGKLNNYERIESKIKKYAECVVIKATANGGYSNMDYVLTIKKQWGDLLCWRRSQ